MNQLPPSSGGNLEGMLEDFSHFLNESDIFTRVSVKKTGDPDHLLVAVCKTHASLKSAAREMARIWTDYLSYRYSEFHTVSLSPDSATLDGITAVDSSSYFVTAQIIAQKDTLHNSGK